MRLSLLGALLAPGGAGLLITDVTSYLLPAHARPHPSAARESLAALPPDVLVIPAEIAARIILV